MNDICKVGGCCNPIRIKKYQMCNAHYLRFKRHGRTERIREEKGSGTIDSLGYRVISVNGRRVREHTFAAEKAVGGRLPSGAHVHHVDYNKTNNAGGNLVICPNSDYHNLLHKRTDAYNATGNPDMRKCFKCGEYDHTENMYEYKNQANNPRYSHKMRKGCCANMEDGK